MTADRRYTEHRFPHVTEDADGLTGTLWTSREKAVRAIAAYWRSIKWCPLHEEPLQGERCYSCDNLEDTEGGE